VSNAAHLHAPNDTGTGILVVTAGCVFNLNFVRYWIETRAGMWRTIRIGGVLVSHHRQYRTRRRRNERGAANNPAFLSFVIQFVVCCL